jgi:hypothetical protein
MLTEIIEDLGRPVAYFPNMARALGVKEAILLQQLIYWMKASDRMSSKHSADITGEVYKTPGDLETEIGFSYKEQRTARKNLVAEGILIERFEPLEHTTYFSVNKKRVNEVWASRNDQMVIPGCPKGNPGIAERASVICTEITQESTSESTGLLPFPEAEHIKQKKLKESINLESVPENLRTKEFLDQWAAWAADRRERRKPLTVRAAETQLAKLAAWGPVKAIKALRTAIENGWVTVYEPVDDRNGPQSSGNGPRTRRDSISEYIPGTGGI